MDKTLAWLWLADAVGSACQNARDLLALYPDPEALYEALCAGREAPPYFLSDHAVAQLCDTTPFDYEERLDHCLLTGVEIITPDDARIACGTCRICRWCCTSPASPPA